MYRISELPVVPYIKSAFYLHVAILWDIALCSLYVNRCYGGTYHLHLQGKKQPR
jgi:hypothetical protein